MCVLEQGTLVATACQNEHSVVSAPVGVHGRSGLVGNAEKSSA